MDLFTKPRNIFNGKCIIWSPPKTIQRQNNPIVILISRLYVIQYKHVFYKRQKQKDRWTNKRFYSLFCHKKTKKKSTRISDSNKNKNKKYSQRKEIITRFPPPQVMTWSYSLYDNRTKPKKKKKKSSKLLYTHARYIKSINKKFMLIEPKR